MRVIDRTLRPLFRKAIARNNDTINCFSEDLDQDPAGVRVNACSAALTISSIPGMDQSVL